MHMAFWRLQQAMEIELQGVPDGFYNEDHETQEMDTIMEDEVNEDNGGSDDEDFNDWELDMLHHTTIMLEKRIQLIVQRHAAAVFHG